MIKIGGIHLNDKKKIKFALLKISGLGLTSASKILFETQINPNLKCLSLSPSNVLTIRNYIEQHYLIENFLKRKVFLKIQDLGNIRCLRGKRHKLKLPVRGQRTRTNARTKRGQKQTVSKKKSK